MESLNARRKLYLATACTTDPIHHIVFVEKIRRWSNRRIVMLQDEALNKDKREGEIIIQDPDLGVARIVCSACQQGGHTAASCSTVIESNTALEIGVEEKEVKTETATERPQQAEVERPQQAEVTISVVDVNH